MLVHILCGFTKNEALKAGIKEDRIRVLGISKCIGKLPIKIDDNPIDIGLILDGLYEDENNIPMIELINQLSDKYNLRYKMRYHPNYIGNEFSNYTNHRCLKSSEKKETLNRFLSSVNICIVANSTVLFELEYYGVPFIRYATGNNKDKFRDYKSVCFTDFKELDEAYLYVKNEQGSIKNNKDNTIDNYRCFFQSFL